MFAMLNFNLENFDAEKAIAEIEKFKDSNLSLANMFQSMLNKYEKFHNLPLTKIVEPIKILDGRTGKELKPRKSE